MHDHLTGAALTNMAAWSGFTIVAMTDAVNIAIVGGVVSIVTSLATLYFAYRAKVTSAEAKDISASTGKAVDGKMDEFKRMAEAFYHAKGVSDEKLAAEGKAGIEAIAQAKGKAEGKAEAIMPAVVAALPPAAPAQGIPIAVKGTLEHAIVELTTAAQDTVTAADKTVDLAEKVPVKPL